MKQDKIARLEENIERLSRKVFKLENIIDSYDAALGDVSLMLCAIKDSDEANVTIRAMARAALCLSVNDKDAIDEEMDDE